MAEHTIKAFDEEIDRLRGLIADARLFVRGAELEIGGEEAMPPTDLNGFGRLAYIEDGQGNIIGLMTRAEEK